MSDSREPESDLTGNQRYTVESDFYRTSTVSDIQLSVSSKGLSRKVLRATLVDNPKIRRNSVELCLVHQRRGSVARQWTDLNESTLANTTVNIPSKLALDTAETRLLFEHLANLYEIGPRGIMPGQATIEVLRDEEAIIRTDSSRARLIRKLLEANHGNEVWELLVQLEPDLAKKLAVSLAVQERQLAIEEFEIAIEGSLDETYWQQFIGNNMWILGSGNVALVSERRIDIKDIADLPIAIEGGFMDIVELKRPDVPFWAQRRSVTGTFLYRDRFLIPDYGLQGAIAQSSHYILQAEKRVSDSDFYVTHGIKPLKPRGLVVHGRSNDWGEKEWEAFRLMNDHLHGIQVMTFDHLLAQGQRAMRMS